MLIMEYKESWVEDFNEIKKNLNKALTNLNILIEHTGSTAVRGLAAKPIIDIIVVFGKHAAFNEIKMSLEKTGYYHNGNQGIPDREVFKRSKAVAAHQVLDYISHHLYVCPTDSEELKQQILFRDYLIANEETKIQYQNLKFEIAREANQDRKKYAALKEIKATKFINCIIEKAKRGKNTKAR
jgi:GrpB-like predicted nucleotidyltransferase (UPF0157 family)